MEAGAPDIRQLRGETDSRGAEGAKGCSPGLPPSLGPCQVLCEAWNTTSPHLFAEQMREKSPQGSV